MTLKGGEHTMDTKQKVRAGVAAGLAGLAAVVGGTAIASGEPALSTSAPGAPSGYAVPAADTQDSAATPDRDHDGRDCPKHDGGGQGSGPGSSDQGTAPVAPTAPSTTPSL